MTIELPTVHAVCVDSVSDAQNFAFEKQRKQVTCQLTTFVWPKENTLASVQQEMWYGNWRTLTPNSVTHILFFQYDGWVLDGSRWDPSWLQYDYIGAPWPWMAEGQNVGNGGFSLRSVKLMRHLSCWTACLSEGIPEDALIGQHLRPGLERKGFKFAPLSVAEKFSVERGAWRSDTFGFHGIFNIPNVLSPRELADWKASANDYIRSKVEWGEI